MPMEMLRMIKRTFRDALGKLLNSKPLSLIFETQQKHLCTLMKTLDIIKCYIYIYHISISIYMYSLYMSLGQQ